jgi:hypothetical protein
MIFEKDFEFMNVANCYYRGYIFVLDIANYNSIEKSHSKKIFSYKPQYDNLL